ncbi:hypothetical protein GTY82_02935 [Streptomyces sp. SID5476]|nr:hypothetical protein [Streptomyces sp. SID5476]
MSGRRGSDHPLRPASPSITDASAACGSGGGHHPGAPRRARRTPPTRRYDLGHLQSFHATIFGDIYPWAGELRTVNIAKRTPFCPARSLVPYAGEVFGRLASSGHLRDLPRREFVIQLATLYGDLNVLHPHCRYRLRRPSRPVRPWGGHGVPCNPGRARAGHASGTRVHSRRR